MSDNARTFAQIFQELQQVFPEVNDGYVRRIADNIINEITIERNLKKKETPIDSISGQMFYDLTDFGSVKVSRVDFMNADGEYVLIPKLIDGEFISKWG